MFTQQTSYDSYKTEILNLTVKEVEQVKLVYALNPRGLADKMTRIVIFNLFQRGSMTTIDS